MTRWMLALFVVLGFVCPAFPSQAGQPNFKVLAFYSVDTEHDHVVFAQQAIAFFTDIARKNNFAFKFTTDWSELNPDTAKQYQVMLWLNDSPHTPSQRTAFEQYMNNGGGWMGFHASGYNDAGTRWPWFVDFLGGAVFYGNNWPPLPALLSVDDRTHPVTKRLPAQFLSPANEWYIWKPDPRSNKNVRVLLTLSPANYPLGLKDTVTGGDLPVVWTNTRYRMLYMNMGHGDKIFGSAEQNAMFEDAILWIAAQMPVHR